MAKSVFITGATSGIGLLVAELCLQKGYDVYATGRNEEVLTQLAEKGAVTFVADLCIRQEMESVIERLPTIDVAILNAGVGFFEMSYQLTDVQVEVMLETNVQVPMLLANRLAVRMMERRTGQLIFIGSQAGKVATKKASVYAATKHAIVGFTNGLRMELAPYNIVVTAVHPGPIDTPFLQKADATNTYREAIQSFLLKPEDVAAEVVRCIEIPVREVNLPRVMGWTSKFYALAPGLVEKLGGRFFNKK